MANITPFSFQDSPVRTVIIADAVHFVGKDICEILGYADSSSAMKQHCRAPVKHHPILDALGRAQETRVLAESDMMRLIVNSKMPAAERFEAWVFEEVLPTIRKTGSYTTPGQSPATERTAVALLVAESTARMLRLDGSSLLGYMGRVTERLAPELIGALPVYAVNVPAGQIGIGSSEPSFSLTELGKKQGIAVSTVVLNKKLAAGGFIEKLTRPSTKGIKAFWSITEKGMAYGRNLTSPKNEREVTPSWFASRFPALLAELA